MGVRWKLLSPFLIDTTGHEADYVRRLGDAILAAGDSADVIAPRRSAIGFRKMPVHAELVPAHRGPAASGVARRVVGKIVRTWNFVRAKAVYQRLFADGDTNTVWLLHTTSFGELDVVLRAYAAIGRANRKGRLKVILRADHHDDPRRIRQFRDVLALAVDGVDLYADTVELTEQMSALAGRAVGLVPVPGIGDQPEGIDPQSRAWTFGYFGLRRRSKGFDRLPAIVAHVSRHVGAFSFQAIVHGNAEVDAVEEHSASERALCDAGAIVRSERLPAAEYVEALFQTGIVILPYDPAEYRYGSSGVFVDALKAGCVAVVPSGTWMAREAARNGLARVFETDFADPVRVGTAVERALQAYYGDTALDSAGIEWATRNSAEGLLAALRKMP